jgi:predicted glutamate--cysteine ligase
MLSKGFEIEVYTGTPQGEVVGLADRIVAALDGFMTEPDSRNVEYTTPPYTSYERLLCALLKPRQRLRAYLSELGDYTLIPGSTLPLSGRDRFWRSDPQNPYHTFIEKTYGTDVVTASVHINIGISDIEKLIQACRLVRVEAPLYLALSAASPFFGGEVTGSHSSRWAVFPHTPAEVPLFSTHAHFIQWTQEQLQLKTMQNVRHLWCSVRPNGDRRPYDLNRLELRICDLIADPIDLLAVTALLEARLYQLFDNPDLDPAVGSDLSLEELAKLARSNELAAAKDSLDAKVRHWQNGREIVVRDWIESLYAEVFPYARREGFSCFLSPVLQILENGNQAQQWLRMYRQNGSLGDTVRQSIVEMADREKDLIGKVCEPILV